MTPDFDEAALRQWLVEYLITNLGCSPESIDPDASMHGLGLSSADAVVLSGELAELLGRSISPIEFWQHPTINALARFLTTGESEPDPDSGGVGAAAPADEPIAVVGLGCRLPGDIGGPEALWRFLSEGRSAVSEVPEDRWSWCDDGTAAVGAALAATTRWGSFLSEVDAFDADFFEISPREAAKMDPQQRLLLEVTHEALEHAGIVPDWLRHTQAGVFVGACVGEYGFLATQDLSQVDAWSGTGGALSIIANRVSYFFDLRGPSVTVDTACSSSLVAVHLACQSLRSGDCNLAIAAGVNLVLSPTVTRSFDQAQAMSPTGRCHSFDARADGFVRGEGCGVAVLKRLSDARRDGDRVLAVVRGSAVNQDGRSNGLMAPNPAAQMAVLRAAYANAGVEPREVDYVEAHGTGTLLGDPIEARALGTVLGRGRPVGAPLLVGAVKSNLGHLEAAAGIAGFLKTVMVLHRGRIPANLNFEQPNPHINFDNLQLKVVAEQTDWPSVGRPRRAGVSSFGFGGTNAHVVLEQDLAPSAGLAGPPHSADALTTLVVSGKTPERVARMAATLADWLTADGASVPLVDVAHTLNHHRSGQAKFATVAARDRDAAVAGLRALADGYSAPGVVGPHQGVCGSGTVFVYSGQGAQWTGMCRQLLADEPAFAAAVAELEPDFLAQVGFSLEEVLAGGEPVVGIERIQPVLVGVQLALTALWRSYRVLPDAVIGHSMGEVTAAVVAGALSPADGLKVIATRSRLMSRLAGQGAMALLELDSDSAERVIANYDGLTLAVHASPRQSVIAGPPEQVDAVIAVVAAQDRLARRIEVDVASHHPIIDPILPELRAELADLQPQQPTIPLITTTLHDTTGGAVVSGGRRSSRIVMDADYWVSNLRNPVRFSQAVGAAGADHATFVEISPHPLLAHAMRDTLADVRPDGDTHVAATVTRDTDETIAFRANLAAVMAPFGQVPQFDSGAGRFTDIPASPWLQSKYWFPRRAARSQAAGAHPLLGVHVETPTDGGHVWQGTVGISTLGFLADHQVHGQPVMPAAAFAEMALAAGSEVLGLPVEAVGVTELEIEQMLLLDNKTRVTTQVVRHDGQRIGVEFHSRSANGSWCRHAVARIGPTESDVEDAPKGPLADNSSAVSPAEFYAALRGTGAHHGPAFAALTRIVRMPGGVAETEIVLPDEVADDSGFRIHPVMLDAAMQSVAAAMPPEFLTDAGDFTYLPVSLGGLRVLGEVGLRARCRAELVSHDADEGVLGSVVLRDEAGQVTAEITGIRVPRVPPRTVPVPLTQKLFGTEWVQTDAFAGAPALAGSWLVLADDGSRSSAREFVAEFGSPARRVVMADLFDEAAVRDAVANAAAAADRPPAGVIVFVAQRSSDAVDPAALARAHELLMAISTSARAVVDAWRGERPRLWVVTRNGLSVEAAEGGDPAIVALKGLIRTWRYPGEAARVLADEPDLRATLVDVDTLCPGALIGELGSSGSDDVIALRGDRRFTERLSRVALGAPAPEGGVVRRDGSYVVTGGLGGIGMVVVRWLVDSGAGRIVLNGRRGPSDEQRRELAELERRAEIVFEAGDIALPGVAERLVSAAEQTGRVLRGVVHAAGVVDDSLVSALSRDNLERVWAPKAAGALRLHEVTVGRELDWWVGFSSVSAVLGSPGQAAYACGNAWLDGLVAWRRAAGLPATAINWGQWSDVGMGRSLNLSLLDPIAPAEGIEALEALVGGGLPQVGVARLRLDRVAAASPEIFELGYFDTMVADLNIRIAGTAGQAGSLDDADQVVLSMQDWSQMSEQQVCGQLEIGLRAILARELRTPASRVDMDRAFPELGVDSMMAMGLLRETKKLVGVDLSPTMLWNHPTISSLAAHLAETIAAEEESRRAEDNEVDAFSESATSVLDELFDSVESAAAGSESSGL